MSPLSFVTCGRLRCSHGFSSDFSQQSFIFLRQMLDRKAEG
jgi:hypothetical protein